MNDNKKVDAYNVVNSASSVESMEELRIAIYRMWTESDDPADREKLHGIAAGAEMFWRIMHKHASEGKVLAEGLSEEFENNLRAVI